MGFLSAYEGTRRVDIDVERGYWIDLVLHISQGAKEAAERAASKVKVNRAGVTEAEPDVVAFRQLMVLGHIRAWNLDDDNGQVWPINLPSLKRLPGDVFEQLWVVVNELTAPPSEADRKRFPDAGDDSDPLGGTGAGEPAHLPDGAAVLAEDRGEPADAA